jgi:hypothetical protein
MLLLFKQVAIKKVTDIFRDLGDAKRILREVSARFRTVESFPVV